MDSLNEIYKIINEKRFKDLDKDTILNIFKINNILSRHFNEDGNLKRKYIGKEITSSFIDGKELERNFDAIVKWINELDHFVIQTDKDDMCTIMTDKENEMKLFKAVDLDLIYLAYELTCYKERYDLFLYYKDEKALISFKLLFG